MVKVTVKAMPVPQLMAKKLMNKKLPKNHKLSEVRDRGWMGQLNRKNSLRRKRRRR
jgi:hypothetical protein